MPKDHDDELKREIQAHLELEAEERVAGGMSETDARYAALRAFGNVARRKRTSSRGERRRWLDEIIQASDTRSARSARAPIHSCSGADACPGDRREHALLHRQRGYPAATWLSRRSSSSS